MNLKGKPYYLSDEDVQWVNDTIASMTTEEKIGQLFCPVGFTKDPTDLLPYLQKGIGGMMYRAGLGAEIQEAHRYLQDHAKVPMFLAANLEAGGTGTASDGTTFGKNMQVAATGDPEQAYRLGYIGCTEGAAVGCNWAFAPVIDININWRNPITNLRTFGSDPDTVLAMGREFCRGAREAGCAVSIKHFPGDGVDERDQHLHLTVNSLDADTWMKTYGMIYRGLIDDGARTVMIGHIAQPAWAKRINPAASEAEAYLPGTLSRELLEGLLRKELGFEGMIVSDATSMGGFTTAMPREQAVPQSIARGVDMFLFNKDFFEDYGFMLKGYQDGVITGERLHEALTRILGVKASLGLHKKQKAGTLVPDAGALKVLANDQFTAWADECADRSVTLVKNKETMLPLTPDKYKRVMLVVVDGGDMFGMHCDLAEKMRAALTERGFTVLDAPENSMAFSDKPNGIKQLKEAFDAAVYVFHFPTASNNTVIRLAWKGVLGFGNLPWFTKEIPVMGISFANPFHLIDVPQIKTFINAYTYTPATLKAVLDKITGVSAFTGKSPVDAFCGREDTAL